MVEAFIFDIDGTLIDSNDFHAKAWQRAFKTHGITIAFSKIRRCMGMGSDQLLPVFLNKTEIKRIGKAVTELREEIFKREYLRLIQPFPKVRALFKKIRKTGARIALASSSNEEEVKRYKVIAQIEDLVETSTSADDAEKSKPEPDIFNSAMRLLQNPPRNSVLVVGDTPYDAIAATRAKLPMVGVLCGGFSAKLLKKNGCGAVFEDAADLLQNLNQVLKLPMPGNSGPPAKKRVPGFSKAAS